MKFVALIAVVILAAVLAACGGGDSSAEAGQARSYSAKEVLERPKPKIDAPSEPPPKQAVVNDLEEGTGRAAKAGDNLSIHLVAFDYESGEEIPSSSSWKPKPYSVELGSSNMLSAWKTALTGMKVGSRRELIIPSNLAYGKGALIYVFDLVSIE